MNSHADYDAIGAERMLRSLKRKAKRMREYGESVITGGGADEKPIWERQHPGSRMLLRKMPDDEHGICRISVGGGASWADIEYCVIRGDEIRCAYLLEQAAAALRWAYERNGEPMDDPIRSDGDDVQDG